MPDWKKEKPRGAPSVVSPDDVNATMTRLAAFMQEAAAHEEVERWYREKPDDAERHANMFFAQALDSGLKAGIDAEIATFVADPVVAALEEHEQRYFQDLPPVADEAAAIAAEPCWRRKRSCIVNVRTGGRRYEVPRVLGPDNFPVAKSLFIATDEGSIGAPFLFWAFSRLRIRGCKVNDFYHRTWNSLKSGVVKAGCWIYVQEMTTVLNGLHGPWGRDAFFGAFQEAGKHYHRTTSADDPLFLHVYKQMCEIRGVPLDLRGSEDHLQATHEGIIRAHCLLAKGDHVRLGRWMSWFRELGRRKSDLGIELLLLVYIGIREKWWATVDESPLCTAEPVVEPVDAPAPAPAGGIPNDGPPQSVKASNAELERLRQQCKNKLELMVRLLGNVERRSIAFIIFAVGQPLQEDFDRTQTIFSTQRGVHELLEGWVCGRDADTCFAVLTQMTKSKCLRECGFGCLPLPEMPANALWLERLLAAKFLKLARCTAGERALQMTQYTHGLPYGFVPLISLDIDTARAALERIENIWNWLQDAEQRALACARTADFLERLQWPRWTWVRELLVSLAEIDFRLPLPRDIERTITEFARGFHSTLLCESAFQMLRSLEKDAPSSIVGCKRAWHGLQVGQLAKDNDRPPVVATHAAKSAVKRRRVPDSLFKADTRDFSLGMATLDSYKDSDYTSPSPQAFLELPMQLEAALRCTWQQLDQLWLTLLCCEGSVVWRLDHPEERVFVLRCTRYGALAWTVQCVAEGAMTVFSFDQPVRGVQPLQHIHVTDMEHWMAKAVWVHSPPERPSESPFQGCQAEHCLIMLAVTRFTRAGAHPPAHR